ncbi:PE family protein [Tomitella biformata]|uniref:PE family protein n=1 Tax=Tomitella biformata TaxID=630403 RepID=UPI000465742F|nr:PE family protein [Tomitella biformata]
MGNGTFVFVSPAALVAAAAQLDGIAEQISISRAAHSPTVHVMPAALEEVSRSVSRNQHQVADSFDIAAETGARELRRAAELLRVQAAAYLQQEIITSAALDIIL